MKRYFHAIITLCLMALLCITALADGTPSGGTVLRVSAVNKSDETVLVGDYYSFAEGWSAAMTLASDSDALNQMGYIRVTVDLLADWLGEDGKLGSGVGFRSGAIYVPENVNVTLNLNANKINRACTSCVFEGGVMYVDENAEVVINGGQDASDSACGTLTGGNNLGGAGGIHIDDGAEVTLHNVKVDGNGAGAGEGAAIALYDGALFTMYGGSLADNLTGSAFSKDGDQAVSGVLYVDDATARLSDVSITENRSLGFSVINGGAVAVKGCGSVTLDGCTVEGNGCDGDSKFGSLFYTDSAESRIVLLSTEIRNNSRSFEYSSGDDASSIFSGNGRITLHGCGVTGNKSYAVFGMAHCVNALVTLSECVIKDNVAELIYVNGNGTVGNELAFEGCSFDRNGIDPEKVTFDADRRLRISLTDCEIGNSTFGDNRFVNIVSSSDQVGSMVGEGSITTIVSILALAVSLAAITLAVVNKEKKRAAVATPNSSDGEG